MSNPEIQYMSLPGLPGYDPNPIPEKKPEEMDSDDEAAADLAPKARPKKRPKDHWCQKFKEIDMYGLTPQMVIGGKHKFKSWWGVCFSILTIASVIYYGVQKGIFMWKNQSSPLHERAIMLGHDSEAGSKVQNLHDNRVGIMLEFEAIDQLKNRTWSNEEYLNQVEDFTKFLKFEVDTIETDFATGDQNRMPSSPIETHLYMDTLLPRIVLNSTLVRMRGDPSFRIILDDEFTTLQEFDAPYKPKAEEADQDTAGEPEKSEHFSTLVSYLMVRPNLALLEERAQSIYVA